MAGRFAYKLIFLVGVLQCRIAGFIDSTDNCKLPGNKSSDINPVKSLAERIESEPGFRRICWIEGIV